MVHKLLGWLRRDVVLTVSLVLAAASCLAVPPSGVYWSYIDYDTLIILFCLMLIVEGLRRQNVFHAIAARVLSRVDTARGLAFTLIFLCFLSSMLITNDVALITFVPFGLMMMRMADMRERLTYTVTLMTVAANLGSMLTPIGNPQNLYLFSLSGLSLPGFLALTGPFAAGAAVLLALCVFFGYRQSVLTIQVGRGDPLDRKSVGCYGALFLLCLLTVAGLIPHGVLLVLVVLVLLWKDRTLFRQVDYSLILTFTFFFIFVGNMKQLEGLQAWISGGAGGPGAAAGGTGQPDHQQRPRRHAPVRVQRGHPRPHRGHQPGRSGHPDRLHGQPDLLQAAGQPVPSQKEEVSGGVHPGERGLPADLILAVSQEEELTWTSTKTPG